MTVVIVLSLASGVAAWFDLVQRNDLLRDMTVRSSSLGASALDIYRSLSDAEATVASAFVSGGTESPALRARYFNDIKRTSEALVVASRDVPDGSTAAAELTVLGTQVPVYAGLVEAARQVFRQGFPLGAAYLREASGLMRDTLLPAAQRLYDSEKVRLAQAVDRSTAFPRTALGLAGLLVLALVVVQIYLTRRTNRVFNIGLAFATVVALAGSAWLGLATEAMAKHVHAGRQLGAEQAQLLAEAQIVALQARADESLSLVARGSGQDFENDFKHAVQELDGLLARAADATPDVQRRAEVDGISQAVLVWKSTHLRLREFDDDGLFPQAVALATGPGANDLPAVFAKVDDALNRGIDRNNALFAQEMAAGARDLVGADVTVEMMVVLLVVGSVGGIQPRIREYR